MAIAMAVPGCALDMGRRSHRPESPVRRSASAELDELDPTIPKLATPLGNFPATEEPNAPLDERDPQSLEAKLGLARLDHLAGRIQLAEQSFREAVVQNPDSALAVTALGMFYASEERWSEAANSLDRAVTLSPSDAVIRHQCAIALARSGQFHKALHEFTLAIGEAEAHYNIGYIHWEQGHIKLAEREFRRSVAIRPGLERAQIMLDRIAATSPSGKLRRAADPVSNHAGVVPAGGLERSRRSTNAIWPERR